MELQEKYLI